MKDKHRMFALEYLANGYRALDAYMVIYETANRNTSESNAYKLLKHPEVKAFIDEKRQEMYESKMIDAMRWVDETAEIAFAKKGDPVYTTPDKLKALQMIQKYLGLDIQKVESKVEQVVFVGEQELED